MFSKSILFALFAIAFVSAAVAEAPAAPQYFSIDDLKAAFESVVNQLSALPTSVAPTDVTTVAATDATTVAASTTAATPVVAAAAPAAPTVVVVVVPKKGKGKGKGLTKPKKNLPKATARKIVKQESVESMEIVV